MLKRTTEVYANKRSRCEGTWRSEVVQRRKGLWIHSAFDGGRCLRAFFRDSGQWIQDAQRRRSCGIRMPARPERIERGERDPRQLTGFDFHLQRGAALIGE